MQMVRNLVEYGRYAGNEAKAAKVLRSHFPRRSLATCVATLRSYAHAYRDGIAFVAAHHAAYDAMRRNLPEPRSAQMSTLEQTFYDAHPGISPQLLSGVLFFIHDWHHVR